MAIRYPPHREQNIQQWIADSTINVSSGTVIPLTNRTLIRINSVDTSAFNFTLENGDRDGLYIILLTESTNGHGDLQATGNVLLKQNFKTDTAGHNIGLIWNSVIGKWIELHRGF